MRKYKTMDKVVKFLRLDGQYKVPLGYSEACRRAELTFMHQRVFCPEERKLVHLEPLPAHLVASSSSLEEALRFVGPDMDDQTALGIALGELCPLSKAKMIDIAPGHDVLAQAPSSAAAQTGKTASIKDWFKPDPHASSSKKRPVKRESTPKPAPTSTPLGPIAQVKSRFFASAVAGPSTLRQATSKSEEARPTPIEVDLTMHDDAELLSENEEIVQNACGHIAGIPSPRRAAIMSTPPKVLVLSPKRPSSSRQPLSESGFSHISSPTTSSPREKGKGKGRADLDDSGYGGDSIEMLGSPRPSPVRANSVQSRASSVAARGARPDVEAFDLTSPEAILQAKREPTQALRIGSQSPVPQKRKRERSDTIAWTSDAIELSPEPDEGDIALSVQTFTAAPAKSEAASKRKCRSPPPKRRNATIPKRKVLKKEPEEDSGVFEKCSPEERAAQQSVIKSWRDKFSSSSSLVVSAFPARWRSTTADLPSRRRVGRAALSYPRQLAAGRYSARQVAQLHTEAFLMFRRRRSKATLLHRRKQKERHLMKEMTLCPALLIYCHRPQSCRKRPRIVWSHFGFDHRSQPKFVDEAIVGDNVFHDACKATYPQLLYATGAMRSFLLRRYQKGHQPVQAEVRSAIHQLSARPTLVS